MLINRGQVTAVPALPPHTRKEVIIISGRAQPLERCQALEALSAVKRPGIERVMSRPKSAEIAHCGLAAEMVAKTPGAASP